MSLINGLWPEQLAIACWNSKGRWKWKETNLWKSVALCLEKHQVVLKLPLWNRPVSVFSCPLFCFAILIAAFNKQPRFKFYYPHPVELLLFRRLTWRVCRRDFWAHLSQAGVVTGSIRKVFTVWNDGPQSAYFPPDAIFRRFRLHSMKTKSPTNGCLLSQVANKCTTTSISERTHSYTGTYLQINTHTHTHTHTLSLSLSSLWNMSLVWHPLSSFPFFSGLAVSRYHTFCYALLWSTPVFYVTKTLLSEFSKLTGQLAHLDLQNCRITDDSLALLPQFCRLRILSLRQCSGITDGGVRHLLGS